MKLTLMNAISLDGFIAHSDGNTDWVDDFDEWEREAKKAGAIIIGRKTFDEIRQDELWPEVTYFVLTGSLKEFEGENVITCWSPEEAIAKAEEQKFKHVLICGGAESNAEFARLGVIDDVVLNIHPILLGHGKPLLGDYDGGLALSGSDYVDRVKYVHFTATVNSKA